MSSAIRPRITINGTSFDQAQQAAAPYIPWLIAANAAAAMVAVLLIVAGSGLVARRRWSVGPLIAWAVLKILLTPALAAINCLAQNATQQAMMKTMPMTNQPGAAIGMTVASVMLIAAAALSCLWGWALPIFTLTWFARPKIKADARAFR